MNRRSQELPHGKQYPKEANHHETRKRGETIIKKDIDEKSLNLTDRLGLAYVRLNCDDWDEFLGPKPEGWDEMPDFDYEFSCVGKRTVYPTKMDIAWPKMQAIKKMIGEANIGKSWALFELGMTEQEWALQCIDEHKFKPETPYFITDESPEESGDEVDDVQESRSEFRKPVLPPLFFFLFALLLAALFFFK